MTLRRTAVACLLVGGAIGAGMGWEKGRSTAAETPAVVVDADTTLATWTAGTITLLVPAALVTSAEGQRLAAELDARFRGMAARLGGPASGAGAGPTVVRYFPDFESKALATGNVLAEHAEDGRVYRVLERGRPLGDGLAEAELLLGRIGFATAAPWLEAGVRVWLADTWLGLPLDDWPVRLRRMHAWPGADFPDRFGDDTYLLTWPAAGWMVRAALAAPGSGSVVERLLEAGRHPESFVVPPPPSAIDPATGAAFPRFGGFVSAPGQAFEPAPPSERPAAEARHLGICLAHAHGPERGYLSRRAADTCRYLREAVHATAVSISPFGYLRSASDPVVHHRDVVRGAGDAGEECDESLIAVTARAHDLGMTVLLAPHLWGRVWCGDWGAADDAGWARLFAEYRRFARHYAAVAAWTGADIYQVGKELKATSHREDDWRALIADVRTIYDGPITYGANWDEYRHIAWWDAVDYIGINQYTPVGDREPATVPEALAGMRAAADALDALAGQVGRPYLLTEIGFTGARDAWERPWESFDPASDTPSPDMQARLYDAALETYLGRPNCRGLFWWKWFTGTESRHRSRSAHDFPPSGTTAEGALARHYRQGVGSP